MSGADSCTRSLRARPEVVSLEATDIRKLDARAAARAAGPRHHRCQLHLAQAGAARGAGARARRPPDLIALIKPQFEAGRAALKKGIVRDAAVQAAVCDDIAACVASLGWTVAGVIPSPIAGGDGNREFLIAAHAAADIAHRCRLSPATARRYGAAP